MTTTEASDPRRHRKIAITTVLGAVLLLAYVLWTLAVFMPGTFFAANHVRVSCPKRLSVAADAPIDITVTSRRGEVPVANADITVTLSADLLDWRESTIFRQAKTDASGHCTVVFSATDLAQATAAMWHVAVVSRLGKGNAYIATVRVATDDLLSPGAVTQPTRISTNDHENYLTDKGRRRPWISFSLAIVISVIASCVLFEFGLAFTPRAPLLGSLALFVLFWMFVVKAFVDYARR